MIALIITMIIAFTWLGYETNWMTIRLVYGASAQIIERKPLARVMPKFEEILCKHGKPHYGDNFKAYKLSAKTVKAFGHTINLVKVRLYYTLP